MVAKKGHLQPHWYSHYSDKICGNAKSAMAMEICCSHAISVAEMQNGKT